MKTAVTHLCQLADQRKAAKHPTLPAHARVKAKYSDKSANELTRCIVDYLTLSGHFATRLQSTGTYRAVFAVVDSHAVFVGIKVGVGKDRLSDDQEQTISDLQQAGASVFLARDFAGFLHLFTAKFLTPPFA